ncbi:TrbI F-type domain-containing protein [Photobacterium damselae]|uniref:TrbI F-type domain-containing protein n=1 Tax=Photobacterium damselae TaxID=38293 RepID=UPI0030F3D77D
MKIDLPTLILGVALSVPSTLIAAHYLTPPPSMAVFDLKGVISDYSQELSTMNLSDEEVARRSRQFSFLVEAMLNRYSTVNNTTIFVEPAVIQGAKNITPEIIGQVKQSLHRYNQR